MIEEEEPDPPFWGPLLAATRPKTLLAAVVPVWLGFALGSKLGGEPISLWLFPYTIAATLCIQIATNFFNDAIDCRKGADTAQRLGPARMAGSGALLPESLIIAGATLCVIAFTCALPLVAARGWPIIVIGIPSLYFTFGYTGGPWPLAYRGLGELFVLLFFGVVAVAGSAFVQSGTWWPEALLLGVQVGLLATVLIAVNNARDIEEDRRSGKRTLAARWGRSFARAEVAACCVVPYLIGILWWSHFDQPKAALIPMLGLVLSALVAVRVWNQEPGETYNKTLALSAIALMNFALLFTMGIYL